MIYKFKSKAAGDLIMMGPSGDQVLRIIGKQPAPKGIIEPAAMAAARPGVTEYEVQAALEALSNLDPGDLIVSGQYYGRVKAMFNERNKKEEKQK